MNKKEYVKLERYNYYVFECEWCGYEMFVSKNNNATKLLKNGCNGCHTDKPIWRLKGDGNADTKAIYIPEYVKDESIDYVYYNMSKNRGN